MLPNTLRATSALARRRARALLTTTALLSLTVAACDADSPTRPDQTPRRSERIIAANGTTLHVVDYGGTGPAVVFLAGLGNSADVFDDFAPRFTGAHHVYAFTRRGFGASGRPTGGYETAALGDDVRALLDSLHIARAVLVGHSVAGDELTDVAARYPDRVAALAYLDAAYDRSGAEARFRAMAEAGALPPTPPPPAAADQRSVAGYRDYLARVYGVRWPEREVRAVNLFDGAGRYLGPATDASVTLAILGGETSPRYDAVRAPVLAIYAVDRGIDRDFPWIAGLAQGRAEAEAQAVKAIDFESAWEADGRAALRQALATARVVEVPQASHYVFLSHPDLVERELRTLLESVR